MDPITSLAPRNTAGHSLAKAEGRAPTTEKLHTVTAEDEQSHRKIKTSVIWLLFCFQALLLRQQYYSASHYHSHF